MKYVPPKWIRERYPGVRWNSVNEKILLTLDDGPTPGVTEKALASLSKYNIKALFFLLGKHVQQYPELAREILAEGHGIGNHTMSHKNLAMSRRKRFESEVFESATVIEEVTGRKPLFFRPPYGRILPGQAKYLEQRGMLVVLWSLLTMDYKNDQKIVTFGVEKFLEPGSILVLHDNESAAEILETSIETIAAAAAEKQLITGTPEECLLSFSAP